MKWFRNLEIFKKFTIIILGICIVGMLLSFLVRPYRGTWIYQYGSLFALLLFYGGMLWSLINTILVISKYRQSLKKNLIWIFLSALPFLYIAIMITIAMLKDYDLERNF